MRYKFRYLNGMFKTGAAIGNPFRNFCLTIALFLIPYYLIGRLTVLIGIEDYFLNGEVWGVIRKIMFICAFLSAGAYCIFRKGVFLYDDRLVIARYTFSTFNLKPRITIYYGEIESVNVNYTDLHFTKYRFSQVVPAGDEAYNVELTLKSGKKYFFSIQDQEEFCQTLNALLENKQ